MDRINYSIIIPHKNSENLLKRCLESIPYRNDIQIIVVDDNSASKENIQKIKEIFPYVKVILTTEGRGAGYVRNVGLKYASGKWLLFADADDFYNETAFSVLDRYINSDNDIIYFFASSIDLNTLLPTPREKDLERIYRKYNSKDVRTEDYIRFKNWVPWNKMIRGDLVRKNCVYFDEIPFGNDLNFSQKISFLAEKYEIIEDRLYCLTYSQDSITYKPRSYELESLSLSLRAQLNIYFKRLHRPFWHKYTCVYIVQIAHRKGIQYAWGYMNYLLKNRKEIQCKVRQNKALIEDFFRLNIENNNAPKYN